MMLMQNTLTFKYKNMKKPLKRKGLGPQGLGSPLKLDPITAIKIGMAAKNVVDGLKKK